MSVISPPVFTDSVNQQFFIEALGGADTIKSYLDTFPDTVYTKAIDSSLVKFLYALLGPVGVGYLRQEYLEARLQFEEAGLQTVNLDDLYGDPFAFARLAAETYVIDASASLLSADERSTIEASDAAYRNRATNYLKAIRAGGTKTGLTLAAESGLNRPVEIIENYRALYDQHSDAPLGLPFLGATTQINEVIVLPRQNAPQNSLQTLSFIGEVAGGWFSLSYPSGSNGIALTVKTTLGSNIVTVPSTVNINPGCFIAITYVGSITYAVVSQIISATQIAIAYPPSGISISNDPPGSNTGIPGYAYNLPYGGTFSAVIGYGQTYALPYNATAAQVQSALTSLPSIGGPNVVCTGGPLPATPIQITFVNGLGDSQVMTLVPNTGPDKNLGIVAAGAGFPEQLVDVTNNPLTVSALVTVDIIGASAPNQVTTIAPADEHAMQLALDDLRPQTVFVTTAAAPSTTMRQNASTIFSGSSYAEITRYVTGTSRVTWPATDSLHWIEAGVEHEGPRPVGDLAHHYTGFHNVESAISYIDAALNDPYYEAPQNLTTPLWVKYYNTHIGAYNPAQAALYPFLSGYRNPDRQFQANDALPDTAEVLAITDTINGVGIIDSIYPKDYLSLPGVDLSIGNHNRFWSSLERASGVDYLEVDLGVAQAVNYIYFEATRKPFIIDVAYDVLDMSPNRHFVPVTLVNSQLAASTTSLSYTATATNPWGVVELHCTNSLSQMIFTRFIRIGFTRTPGRSPLAPVGNQVIPYSVEVRNLRIGRNVA